jgi:AbrB family looped-hinge helix DNA binding protein
LSEKTKIHRVYNQNPSSLAVIIPKDLAAGLGIKNGSYVEIDADADTITIRKVNIGKRERTT